MTANGSAANEIHEVPTLIPELRGAIDIVYVPFGYLALLNTGEVYAWGAGRDGTLGLGGKSGSDACPSNPPFLDGMTAISKPQRVTELSDVIAITGGRSPAATTRDGKIYQWGATFNSLGQKIDANRPLKILENLGVSKLVGAWDVVFGLLPDGQVIGWGVNNSSNFGDGTTAPVWPPRKIDGYIGAVDLVADLSGRTISLDRFGNVLVRGGWIGSDGKPRAFGPIRGVDIPLENIPGLDRNGILLPKIVRLTNYEGLVTAVGDDELTYQLLSDQDDINLRWRTQFYPGLPPPQ
jgi:hypothetical protein